MPERNSLKIHRQRAGVTLQWLAKRLHTSVMELDALEQGKVSLTPAKCEQIAKVLRILPYHLVGMCDCTATPPAPVEAPAPPPPRGAKSHARL